MSTNKKPRKNKPKRSDSQTRMTISLDKDLREYVEKQSQIERMDMSTYIRHLLVKEIRSTYGRDISEDPK